MKHLRWFRCWVTGHRWTDRRYEPLFGCWTYDCHKCERVQMRWFE